MQLGSGGTVSPSVSSVLDQGATGPFRGFLTHMWQNAYASTVRHVMVCDVYFLFTEIL